MTRRTRFLTCAAALALLAAPPLDAESAGQAPAPSNLALRPLSDYSFHLNAASFATQDERFTWDANFGGDLDLVDYDVGRMNVLVNYEVVLGEEFRAFDPNQSNFTLDVSSSWRLKWAEVAGVFHHVSRHLVDRPKQFPIDWNMVGVQAARSLKTGRFAVDGRVHILGVINKSFVDYRSEFGAEVAGRYEVSQRVAAIGATAFRLVDVDSTIYQRDMLAGAHLEGGLRIAGSRGVVELFLAVERRIDANALDRAAHNWGLLGFRLLNK